ncbi:MAG: universal stress protein [Balneolaceae bacterium]
MITFRKILVPTDFSDNTTGSYAAAQKAADIFGGKVDFLHVVPTLKYLNESIKRLGAPLDMNKDVYPKIVEESKLRAGKLMQQYITDKNRGEAHVHIDRKPSDAIVDFALKNDYDMIIIGAKGSHGTSMFVGSTTEKVIRKSKVPVFVIPDRLNTDTIKNIVVPTDGSALSFSAFPMAVALAEAFNSSLTLLRVIELYGSDPVNGGEKKNELDAVYEKTIANLNTFLQDQQIESIHVQRTGVMNEDTVTITDGENSRSISLTTIVTKGVSAHYEITGYLEESGDLLIMATHGHSGFAHLVLGSTAERVSLHVSKPTITVRPDKELFER